MDRNNSTRGDDIENLIDQVSIKKQKNSQREDLSGIDVKNAPVVNTMGGDKPSQKIESVSLDTLSNPKKLLKKQKDKKNTDEDSQVGNSFTTLFGTKEDTEKKENTTHSLNASVENQDGEKSAEVLKKSKISLAGDDPRIHENPLSEEEQKEEKKLEEEKAKLSKEEVYLKKLKSYLGLTYTATGLCVVLWIVSLLTSQILLSIDGPFSNIYSKNFGRELQKMEEQSTQIKNEFRSSQKEIKQSQERIEGIKNNELLAAVIENRIDWLEAIERIAQVTEKINYSGNNVVFDSYSANTSSSTIDISGQIVDASGRIFHKMARLVEAFNESPYFEGAQVTNFSKSENGVDGFSTAFNFQLQYFEHGEEEPDHEKVIQ